jgi:hypothetical protein
MEAVEDEGLVGDGGADVTEGIGEGLEAMAVGGDAEVALHDRAKLRLEVDGERHLVTTRKIAIGSIHTRSALTKWCVAVI